MQPGKASIKATIAEGKIEPCRFKLNMERTFEVKRSVSNSNDYSSNMTLK